MIKCHFGKREISHPISRNVALAVLPESERCWFELSDLLTLLSATEATE